ncbi:helix-turn-helix transcriptional regulator [Kineococcus sp. SYSU DK005]|uniref:helix-turn-helix transcriptional regulator n=1 Tax=Kineococcus sp. SYSU DK005 TaxID=3383126 RepID=UPI003D7E9A2B
MLTHGITAAAHEHGMHVQRAQDPAELPTHLNSHPGSHPDAHPGTPGTADSAGAPGPRSTARVVLTDLRSARACALLIQRHHSQHPHSHLHQAGAVLVVLLDEPDRAAQPSAYLSALRAGAHGIARTAAPLAELIAVIDAAARGFTVLPAAVARALGAQLAAAAVPTPQLSTAERTWLRQLSDGASVSEVAVRSGYSERETYRLLARTYQRLGASSRTEALLIAQRAGLLTARADPAAPEQA